jgi:outer membrane receptor protein involved in Fe transport
MVSRGYNGGGAGFTYNPPFESYTFDSEYVWTYEAYARADLLDDTLSLTANAFYSDYKDMQLPFDLNPDPTVWSVVVRNADRAVTYGAEVGARWLAAPELELFADLGLLQTEVSEYPGSGIEGNDLAQAPAFTSNVGLVYKHDSGIEFSADARFSDAYYSSINNDPRGKTDPYVVVNSKLGYHFANEWGDLRIFAFVHNIFDTEEPNYLQPGATAADDVAGLLPPRTVGVGLEMRF